MCIIVCQCEHVQCTGWKVTVNVVFKLICVQIHERTQSSKYCREKVELLFRVGPNLRGLTPRRFVCNSGSNETMQNFLGSIVENFRDFLVIFF